MKNIICTYISRALIPAFLLLASSGFSQMITGSWKGRINRQKVEVKIIQSGDSLTGTSYYFESPNNYRRYSIKGYFDELTNSAVWWDDQLLEEKSSRFSLSTPGKVAMLSRADFNCPGGGKMMLDGKSFLKEKETDPNGEVHLDKSNNPQFEDEWDFVIDNYTVGGNDPDIIDSIKAIALNKQPRGLPVEQPQPSRPVESPGPAVKIPEKPVVVIAKKEPLPQIVTPAITKVSIEEKFTRREKKLVKEIPLTGDTLELRFYDNAEIDGDSISLFLNDKLIFEHIRLTGSAYSVKLAVGDLAASSELTMVAENLGGIPPNTSYMLAINGDKRYDAYLASTEGSSAMIRFVKTIPPR